MSRLPCEPPFEPVRPSYLVFGSPLILDDEIDEMVATLRSGWIGTGPKVAAFERNFANYIGVRHVAALHSCTSALHLALLATGLQPNEEVIVPSMTFAATASAVIHAGGRPVFADVDRHTMCLETEEVASRITERTRAIIPVHFAGRPCDMPSLCELAAKHNLVVIEDCAHAIESQIDGQHVGTFGNAGAFSFYVTKNVVTGEGGMLVTDNQEWAERIKTLALHGLSADAWQRFSDTGFKHYEVTEPGFKYNMTDMQASLGIHQLKRIEANLVRREEIWQRYDVAFEDLPVFVPLKAEKGTRHARHLYTLLLDLEHLSCRRDDVQQMLHQQNIGTGIHYLALHLHKYYRKTFAYQSGDLPDTEWISERTLSLPLSPKLTDEDVEDVVLAVRRTLEYCAA